MSIADINAPAYGVHLSRGSGPGADTPALEGIAAAGDLAERGRFTVPVAAVFALQEAAAAHEVE